MLSATIAAISYGLGHLLPEQKADEPVAGE
jgi:hypothetical protein